MNDNIDDFNDDLDLDGVEETEVKPDADPTPEYVRADQFREFAETLLGQVQELKGKFEPAPANDLEPEDDYTDWKAPIVNEVGGKVTAEMRQMFEQYKAEQDARILPRVREDFFARVAGDLDESVRATASELTKDWNVDTFHGIDSRAENVLRGYLENESRKARESKRGTRPTDIAGGDGYAPAPANDSVAMMIQTLGLTGKEAQEFRANAGKKGGK
jgi:hypothetical protein